MTRSVLDGFAAKIRANVRSRADGDVDVKASRASFDAMGRIPTIFGGTLFERFAVVDAAAKHVPVLEKIKPDLCDDKREVLYFHGGAFICGTLEGYRSMVSHLAAACRAPVDVLEYRLAPENPYPAAHDDALAAWKHLSQTKKSWVLMGDSAGANLALATMVAARDAGQPLPAAAVFVSPMLDLTLSGASVKTNAEKDPLVREGDSRAYASLYLKSASPSDPRPSPLFADVHGLPPIYVQVGKDEVLYDDAARFADKARAAGVDVTLDAFDGVFHVWHFLAGIAPESDDAIARIGKFVRAHAT
ncbi:MAG TPA: alpha/beta hydrolase [Polyangiaceae bacterium]|jgi:acetyl esterase/lipase